MSPSNVINFTNNKPLKIEVT